MKLIITFLCVLTTNFIVHSQNLDKNDVSFLSIKFDTVLELESDLNAAVNLLPRDVSFSFYNLKPTDYNRIFFGERINTEELNKKLFSNIKIVENTYLDHERFLRGCGYLEDGFTNPIDSSGLMASMVLNNFVNNVLFKDRGPLTKLFYPKN